MNQQTAGGQPFRFFDNREKYLMFVTTCSEKQVSAERIGRELDQPTPRPPAMSQSAYLEATQSTLTQHGGPWFRNECFVVSRNS